MHTLGTSLMAMAWRFSKLGFVSIPGHVGKCGAASLDRQADTMLSAQASAACLLAQPADSLSSQ